MRILISHIFCMYSKWNCLSTSSDVMERKLSAIKSNHLAIIYLIAKHKQAKEIKDRTKKVK